MSSMLIALGLGLLCLAGAWFGLRAAFRSASTSCRVDDISTLHYMASLLLAHLQEPGEKAVRGSIESEARALVRTAAERAPASLFRSSILPLAAWLDNRQRHANALETPQGVASLAAIVRQLVQSLEAQLGPFACLQELPGSSGQVRR